MTAVTQREQASSDWRPLALWCVALGAGLALLLLSGTGQLATPALTDLAGWRAWWAAGDPVVAVMALLRLVGLALCWYLVGVTGVSLLARTLRLARLVRVADALSFGPVRFVVQQAVGATLAASVVVGASGGATVAAPPPPPVAGALVAGEDAAAAAPGSARAGEEAPASGATASMQPLDAAAPGVATMAPLGVPVPAPSRPAAATGTGDGPWVADGDVTASGAAVAVDTGAAAQGGGAGSRGASDAAAARADADAAAVEEPGAVGAGAAAAGHDVRTRRTVTVRPGDHLWSLASQDVASVLGRAPTDAEVVTHWEAVVDANADRLAVPGNPDLLLPGQDVVLPAVVVPGR